MKMFSVEWKIDISDLSESFGVSSGDIIVWPGELGSRCERKLLGEAACQGLVVAVVTRVLWLQLAAWQAGQRIARTSGRVRGRAQLGQTVAHCAAKGAVTEAGELSEAATSGDAEAGRQLGHHQQLLGVLERIVRLRVVRGGGRVVEAVQGVEAAANQLPRGGTGRGWGHQALAEDGGCLMNAGLAPGKRVTIS